MFVLKLNHLASIRGIHLSWGWFRKQGFSHWVSAKLMKGNVKSLRFKDMEKLCSAFKCLPNDLFIWVPTGIALGNIPTHHFQELNHRKTEAWRVGEMTYEQLTDLGKTLKEKKEEGNKK